MLPYEKQIQYLLRAVSFYLVRHPEDEMALLAPEFKEYSRYFGTAEDLTDDILLAASEALSGT